MQSSRKVRWLLVMLVAAGGLFASPGTVRAQDDDDDRTVLDARIEGMSEKGDDVANLKKQVSGGSGLYWILLVFLGGLTAGVLFKDARRSHLD